MSKRNEKIIFDVGMHRGGDTQFYLKKGFQVIGFEANPKIVEFCKAQFADAIKSGQLIIVEGAIVENPTLEKVTFYLSQEMEIWGTVNEDFVKRHEALGIKHQKIDVETVNFADCLSEYGIPYYLKIDIEGVDKSCLKALYQFSEKPKFISIEADKLSFEGIFDEISLLWGLGYKKFKAIQQLSIVSAIPPKLAKEGLAVEHTFDLGSSGLFGEETPDRWLNVQEILARYQRILLRHRLFGDEPLLKGTGILKLAKILSPPYGLWSGWYDTHAKIAD